ncbi:MAG: cobalamin biosynthesis protein CobQ [Heteroscytonema crispum UTEX LB 1556]
MTATPGKRKRGRPKNNPATSSVDLSNQENPNDLDNFDLEVTDSLTNTEFVEDWERELDGDASLHDSDLAISNGVDHQEIAVVSSADTNAVSDKTQQLNSDNGVYILEDERDFKQSTTIHIIDGEKGGCGKSFLCRAFIEYCKSINYNMAIIDADTSNQDISKIYPNVEVAFFSDDEKQAQETDKIFDLAFESSVIVNLPAQVYTKFSDWITRNNLADLGKEHSIFFIKWFVCTGGVDSVNFFLKSLSDLGDKINHVFVKNMGLCDDWSYIDQMPELEAAARKYQFMVMDFPKFPFWERNMIDRLEITFSDAIAHPELKVVSKQRVKNFLKLTYEAFAATGLIR